jgi:hypothetical protein
MMTNYEARQVQAALLRDRQRGREYTIADVIPGRIREAQLIAEAERAARLRFLEKANRAGGNALQQ